MWLQLLKKKQAVQYHSIRIVKKFGGNPEKTLLCHMQRNLDKYYYEKVFQTGASICFDEANKAMYRPDSAIAEAIKYLVDKGKRY